MSEDTKNFTVDKVAWHTGTQGNPEPREKILKRFWTVSQFLYENDLVVHRLVESPDRITDEFSIGSTDLTAEGLALMRAAYDPWLRYLSRGGKPENVKLLQKALSKIRESLPEPPAKADRSK